LQSQAARRLLCAPTALAGADATARQLANTITVASGRTVTVVIYDNSLRPIIGGSSPRLDAGRLALARAGQETTPEVADSSAGTLLSVGFPIQIGAASPCGIAQLSVPMQPIDDVLVRERLVLAGGGVVALLLALAAGLMLTGRRAAEPTDRTVS
jgi:hypothetical protein